MRQDYDKFGVVDMNDKQALFRLIQTLNASPDSLVLTPQASALGSGEARGVSLGEDPVSLVDLDADDTDFLTDVSETC